MRRLILILALLILTGCTNQLVCRHQIGAIALWAEERGLDYQVVIYQTPEWISLGLFDSHAQIYIKGKGWISTDIGPSVFFDTPTYEGSAWEMRFSFREYVDLMRKNCFGGRDCKELENYMRYFYRGKK